MDDSWSRSDEKRKNRIVEDALERLAQDVAGVPEKKLSELELSEELMDAVITVQRIKSPPARNRQLRLVRSLLRDADWSTIEARVKAIALHGTVGAVGTDPEVTRREASWALRLLGEGSVGLDAFLAEFPGADRTHLRTLVRNVDKSTNERRTKAEEKLRSALRSFLR